MQSIPVFKPLLEQEELGAAEEALRLGWLGPGSYVGRFEDALHALCEAGKRKVVAVSTGHAAIHLALLRMGVGPGDEVITPALNNIADLQAIRATGAEPVFCDVDADTLCIDPSRAAELVGPRTRALIATDYACSLCDHDALGELAARSGLRLLHDAAHSFGSRYRGRAIGSFSDITMFSFDPVKTVTAIDGGALVVQSEEDKAWLREARLIGMGQPSEVMYQDRRAWTYDVRGLGFRYHMANLHAAIGLAQIAKFARIAATRLATARRFSAGLRGIAGLRLPPGDFADVVPFMYYVRVPAERREAFKAHLEQRGIDHGLHWQPGHWFSYFRGCRRGALEVTEKAGRELVTIPLHTAMPREWEDRVVDAVRSFWR
jgi:dTDP-4-amino-4,6-dideoxygalactose transaminase